MRPFSGKIQNNALIKNLSTPGHEFGHLKNIKYITLPHKGFSD